MSNRSKTARIARLLPIAVLVWFTGVAGAAQVSLDDVRGAAGATVDVSLSIDDLVLEPSGAFSLTLDLAFDPTLLTPGSARVGDLASADFFLFPLLTSTAGSGTAILTLEAFDATGSGVATSLGGGTLAVLPFTIATDALPLASSVITLSVFDSSPAVTLPAGGGAGSVTVVPLPAAVWMMFGAIGVIAAGIRRSTAASV